MEGGKWEKEWLADGEFFAFVDEVNLVVPEAGVAAAGGAEGVVGALFEDAAMVEDDDVIGLADGGEAVGNDEDGALAHEVVERLLDLAFGDGVHAGGGLVEDDKRRVFQEDAGDGEALFFALGETDALFADVGLQAQRKGLNEVPGGGAFEGGDHGGLGDIGADEAEVVGDGAFKEERVLGDKADLGVEFGEVEFADIEAAEEDAAGGDIIGAHDEVGDSAFAGAGVADEGGDLAGGEVEGEVFEDGGAAGVGEADVLEAGAERAGRQGLGVGRAGDFDGVVEDFKDAVAGGAALADPLVDLVEFADGLVEEHDIHEEGEPFGDGEGAGVVQANPAADADDDDDAEAGDEGGAGAVIGPGEDGLEAGGAEGLGLVQEAAALVVLEAESLDEAVALDVFDEEAVQVGGGFADVFPEFVGIAGVGDAPEVENGQGEKRAGGEEGVFIPEHDADADESEDGTQALVGAVEEDAFDVGDVVDDAGGDFAGLALVVKGHGELKQAGMDVAAEVDEDFLLEGVVDADAEAVEALAHAEENGDEGDACAELGAGAVGEDVLEDVLDLVGDGDEREGGHDREEQHEQKEPAITQEIPGNPPDSAHARTIEDEGRGMKDEMETEMENGKGGRAGEWKRAAGRSLTRRRGWGYSKTNIRTLFLSDFGFRRRLYPTRQ